METTRRWDRHYHHLRRWRRPVSRGFYGPYPDPDPECTGGDRRGLPRTRGSSSASEAVPVKRLQVAPLAIRNTPWRGTGMPAGLRARWLGSRRVLLPWSPLPSAQVRSAFFVRHGEPRAEGIRGVTSLQGESWARRGEQLLPKQVYWLSRACRRSWTYLPLPSPASHPQESCFW